MRAGRLRQDVAAPAVVHVLRQDDACRRGTRLVPRGHDRARDLEHSGERAVVAASSETSRRKFNVSLVLLAAVALKIRGGTIHRCIDISRYLSRDTYLDIVFYNRNLFLFLI